MKIKGIIKVCEWDLPQIYENEIEYYKNNWQELYDKKPTEEELATKIYNDETLIYDYWEDLLYQINDLMTWSNRNNYYKGYWLVKVTHFGWRNENGEMYLKAETPKQFLQKILPNTENTFYVYKKGKNTILIRNYHHDSPIGNEWYEIKPANKRDVEEIHTDYWIK